MNRESGLKTNDIRARLKERFAPPAYALFEEVADGTGFSVRRHVDAMAFSLWPSRGLSITGFEIKVSRSDWMKELKMPEKAEALAQHCDYFYLVVGDSKIVQPGELPEAWGLMVPFGQKLKVEKEALKTPAKPLDRSFMMAVARKALDTQVAQSEIVQLKNQHKRELEAELARGVEKGRKSADPGLYGKYKELREAVDRFKAVSGIEIGQNWDANWPEEVGKAINAIRRSSDYDVRRLRDVAKTLDLVATAFETTFESPISEVAKA